MRRVVWAVPAGFRDRAMHATAAAAGAPRARAPAFVDPPRYARYRPETTLRYQLVEQYYPVFRELRTEAGCALPALS